MEYDPEVIPNLPTSLISSGQFNIRTWFVSVLDSVLIGVLGGLASIAFIYLIQFFDWLFFNVLGDGLALKVGGLNLTYILLPAIGGAIIGPVLMKYAPEVRGEGIPEVMEAVVMKDVVIRKRVGFFKAIASAITIGSGGSAGREGPIAQIGSSVGSTIGQVFKLDTSRTRHMVVCGCAAGIAGIFKAPFGGAFFALEVLGGTIVVLDAVPVFISALMSYAVVVLIQGPILSFPGASIAGLTSGAYGIVILFGLVMGLIAVCWHTIFNKTKGLVDKITIDSKYKPILGGLVTGVVGVFFVGDGIFGLGHEGIEAALVGEFTIGMLLLLAAAKMVATSFTLASGGSGGLFTPTLYIGAMFGGALGLLFAFLWPQTVTDPTLFAIIGMGALFAGASQCPINTIIMIPEMTGNYALIFPQMVASLISYAVFRLFKHGSSIYTIKLERRGVPIKMGGQIDLSRIKASDIMATGVPVVDSQITLSQLEDINLQRKLTVYPVAQEGNLIGSISTSKIIEIPHDLHDEIRIEELVTRGIITAPPDAPVEKVQAMRVENGIDCLFVVDESDPTKILGIISHAEILSIYERLKAGHLKIGNATD